MSQIRSDSFYGEYHGHKVKHLEKLLPPLRSSSDSLIWTAGDSSLDNKYWFPNRSDAIGAYADVLVPPQSKQDVTYWLNYFLKDRQQRRAAINCAVEATTLNERTFRMRSQDKFIQNNIQQDDVLIVSVGGNDIALYPTPCTILSMAGLICLPKTCIENSCSLCALPINDCCCGCGPSMLSCIGSWPPCFGYFKHLFGVRVKHYIEKLVAKTKPRKVLVCMIYYLDENNVPSWANTALGALGYNSDPEKLQLIIRKCFEEITSQIKIDGTEVIPVPLFHALNGKISEDYVDRVEPSAIGGKKMAEYLLDTIDGRLPNDHMAQLGYTAPAPLIDRMNERG